MDQGELQGRGTKGVTWLSGLQSYRDEGHEEVHDSLPSNYVYNSS